MLGDHFYTTSASERDTAVTSFGYTSEGIACNIYLQPRAPQVGDHTYTTSAATRDGLISTLGYRDEGIACYVLPGSGAGAIPLYRLFNFSVYDNFFTTSAVERDAASGYGYSYQDIAAFVLPTASPGTTPLFRLRSTQSGDHFYTISAQEHDNAINQHHYISEGVQCYVFAGPAAGRAPLFRLFRAEDPTTPVPLFRLLSPKGDHFYTTSQAESQAAINRLGYRSEGIVGFVLPDGRSTITQPLFRLLSRETGDHFYTASATERDYAVAHFDYASEGTAAWVFPSAIHTLSPYPGIIGPLYRLFKTREQVVPPSPAMTCDGKPATANAQVYVFMAQDNVTKLIYQNQTWSKFANSASDAQACAQRDVDSVAAGASAVRLDSLKNFFFSVYSEDGACLPPALVLNTSSADAKTSLFVSTCQNCSFTDITADLTDPENGTIDGDKLMNWCKNHPSPG